VAQVFKAAELGQTVDKATFAERSAALREALLDAQSRLASAKLSVVVVVEGGAGAGKREAVSTLVDWLDARRVEIHALGSPSEEERERPEYYRFWRRLPPQGRLGIFFGSWYSEPITQHSLGKLGEAGFEVAVRRIGEFEQMLAAEGVLLVKLWLHLTRRQQKKRFEQLARNKSTAWRVTAEDLRLHKTYDTFLDSASRALRRTDTGHSPWHIVEAWDARHRYLAVGESLLRALEARLNAPAPAPEPPRIDPVPTVPNVLSTLDLSLQLTKGAYQQRLTALQLDLGLRFRPLKKRRQSMVLVFEGVDASGKGGAIRRIIQALDARFYHVVQIAAPTDEELARPYLWRFWRQLPRWGSLTIFDRSWYGRVLVERLEGFCSQADWQRAFNEINAFEEQLVQAGSIVVKFWLSISSDEQLRRFEAREARSYKRYKMTEEDWRNRARWDAYQAAACEMLQRTNSPLAPWTLVEAEDKNFARIKVLQTVADALRRSKA